MNKEQIINTAKVIALALVFSIGVQYVAAQTTWTPPTSAPPGGNTFAPLNVGSSGQVKDGGLTLGYSLSATAPALIIKNGKLCLPQGTGSLPPEGDCRSSWPAGGSGSGMTCTGNCTAGFIPFFYDSQQLTRSAILQTGLGTNARVGISTASNPTSFTPQATLDIQGDLQIRGVGGAPASKTGKVLTAANDSGLSRWATKNTYQANNSVGGEVRVNTNTTVQAGFCALTKVNTGGCDSGASCSVEWSASASRYQVVASNWGDCDDGNRVECTAVCLE